MPYSNGQVSDSRRLKVKTKLDAPYISYKIWPRKIPERGVPTQGEKTDDPKTTIHRKIASGPQNSVGLGKRDTQTLKAIEAKFLSPKQVARDTLTTLEARFKDKKAAAEKWLAARGQETPAILKSDRGSQSSADGTSKTSGVSKNPSEQLASKAPLIRFQPVNVPVQVYLKRYQTQPIQTAHNSKDNEESHRPVIRKYLKNDTTDAKLKESLGKAIAASERMLKGRSPPSSLSVLLHEQPNSDDNSKSTLIRKHWPSKREYVQGVNGRRTEQD